MSMTLNISQKDAEKIASYIKNIAGNVSASDIVEIVLKTPAATEKVKPKSKPEVTMTSREIADVLGRPHTVVVKQIAKFLCEDKKREEIGFTLTSFVCSHRNRKSYPMYELTEEACKIYRKLVAECGSGIKSVTEGLKRYDRAMAERFHPEMKGSDGIAMGSNFLLEGKPKSEYQEYCDMFDQFITGPGVEGREIKELSEKYQKFYEVMKSTQLRTQESNALESAMFDVAIDAEMQGFIYGFKMFVALLNRQLEVAV